MKTITHTLKNLWISNTAHVLFRTYMMPILFAVISLTSCDKDDDDGFNADVAKIVGTYSVEDTFENGDVDNYTITISEAKDGGLEISNFGDIMYVPVKATINGNNFMVPPQTFKGKSMTIIITGSGTMAGDKLTFDYTIDSGDDSLLEHTCVASKNK